MPSAKQQKSPSSKSIPPKAPHQVQRRNERERRRVEQVNNGFVRLRNKICTKTSLQRTAQGKKLSKVETLREASKYIIELNNMLNNGYGQSSQTTQHPPMPMFNENTLNALSAFAYSFSPSSSFESMTANVSPASSSTSHHSSDNSFEEQKYFPNGALYH